MPEFPIQQLTDDIARALSAEDHDDAARRHLSAFDALNERTIAQRGVKVACREGCAICCWLRVDVFAHEVFLIAHHVREHFGAEELAALRVRLDAHSAAVLPLTPFEHATRNVECPLHREGRCTVYSVRPQSCRRHHSRDLAACQFTYDHPTDLEAPAAHDRELFRALSAAMQGNIEAYAEYRFDHTIYELGTALDEALADPESWRRWRDREQAFLRASITPAA